MPVLCYVITRRSVSLGVQVHSGGVPGSAEAAADRVPGLPHARRQRAGQVRRGAREGGAVPGQAGDAGERRSGLHRGRGGLAAGARLREGGELAADHGRGAEGRHEDGGPGRGRGQRGFREAVPTREGDPQASGGPEQRRRGDDGAAHVQRDQQGVAGLAAGQDGGPGHLPHLQAEALHRPVPPEAEEPALSAAEAGAPARGAAARGDGAAARADVQGGEAGAAREQGDAGRADGGRGEGRGHQGGGRRAVREPRNRKLEGDTEGDAAGEGRTQ